jgi:hypothetical protein
LHKSHNSYSAAVSERRKSGRALIVVTVTRTLCELIVALAIPQQKYKKRHQKTTSKNDILLASLAR